MLPWMETLPISEWVATSDWGYPLLLSVHSMGMAIVVGILVMFDVRLLGAARMLPLAIFERLVPIAWFGFLLNLCSGMLLFMSMASRLAVNWPFLSKIAAILIGGAVTWLVWRSVRADAAANGGSIGELDALGASEIGGEIGGETAVALDCPAISARTRALAILSLVIWFSAILFGRLIAYVLDAALLNGDL